MEDVYAVIYVGHIHQERQKAVNLPVQGPCKPCAIWQAYSVITQHMLLCSACLTCNIAAHLKVKVKEVARLNLGGCIQASLGRDEEGGGGAVPEGVCLSGHLCLCHCVCQLLQVAVSLQHIASCT